MGEDTGKVWKQACEGRLPGSPSCLPTQEGQGGFDLQHPSGRPPCRTNSRNVQAKQFWEEAMEVQNERK